MHETEDDAEEGWAREGQFASCPSQHWGLSSGQRECRESQDRIEGEHRSMRMPMRERRTHARIGGGVRDRAHDATECFVRHERIDLDNMKKMLSTAAGFH